MAHSHDAAAHAAHAHHSADDEYREVEGSTYEHTDADVWTIAKFGFWLALVAIVVHAGMALLYMLLIRQATETREPQYPVATSMEPRLPSGPRLQQFPATDIYEFRLQEERRMQSYGWVNKDAGTVHIPIQDAMRLTLERGVLQSRPQDASQPAATPQVFASDASSGRVMEVRRQ